MGDWILDTGIGLAIGLMATILVTVYFLKRRKLAYQTASVSYFERSGVVLPAGFTMTFQGQRVKRLAKATVIVWNAGYEDLRGEDIVEDDPIRVCFDERTRVLFHEVFGMTNEANRVVVETREGALNELTVKYDYLNARDGFVLYAIHDGGQEHPRVVGTAKGLPDGPQNRGTSQLGEDPTERNLRRQDQVGAVMFVCVVLYLVGWWFDVPELVGMPHLTPDVDVHGIAPLVGTILFALVLLVPFLTTLTSRRRYPKSLVRHLPGG